MPSSLLHATSPSTIFPCLSHRRYEAAGWGWEDADKAQELFHEESLLLIVYHESGQRGDKKRKLRQNSDGSRMIAGGDSSRETSAGPSVELDEIDAFLLEEEAEAETEDRDQPPVAVLNVRFEMDEGRPCIYIYEVQVAQSHRGQKIGEKLMGLVSFLSALSSPPLPRSARLAHRDFVPGAPSRSRTGSHSVSADRLQGESRGSEILSSTRVSPAACAWGDRLAHPARPLDSVPSRTWPSSFLPLQVQTGHHRPRRVWRPRRDPSHPRTSAESRGIFVRSRRG